MYFIFNSMLLPGICSPLCSRYLKHCTFAQEASLSSEVKGIEVCFLAYSLPTCQQQVFGHVGNGIAINQFVPSDWERGGHGAGDTHTCSRSLVPHQELQTFVDALVLGCCGCWSKGTGWFSSRGAALSLPCRNWCCSMPAGTGAKMLWEVHARMSCPSRQE